MDNLCVDCKYFDCYYGFPENERDQQIELECSGLCHRFPPAETGFPETFSIDWCGEFKPR